MTSQQLSFELTIDDKDSVSELLIDSDSGTDNCCVFYPPMYVHSVGAGTHLNHSEYCECGPSHPRSCMFCLCV